MTFKTLAFRSVGLDLRSLALMRILLALLIVADLISRATDMTAHYTDLGVLPRAPLIEKWTNTWFVSAHFMNGTWTFMSVMFVLNAILAILLLIGWRTRLMTVLNWLFMISLQARNPMVLQAGDVLFRLLLFWAMFLPTGARYSVDAALGVDEQAVENKHLSVAGIALVLQVCSVYWFTVLQKVGREWWPDGTAVYYALHIDTLATRYGVWLRQFGPLLKMLTFGSLAAEALLPFLLLVPLWPIRFLAVLALMGMHLSFGMFLELGNFPWIDIVSLVPLIPTPVWDWASRRLRTVERMRLTIYVAAGLPDSLARVGRSFGLIAQTRIEPMEFCPAAGPTWTLETADGRKLVGPEALREVARLSSFGPWIANTFLRLMSRVPSVSPPGAGAWLERMLRRRPVFLHPSLANQIIAGVCFAGATWWNLTTVPNLGVFLPHWVGILDSSLRIDQQWAMFAPFPVKDDGWFVVDGELRNHRHVNVQHGEEMTAPDYAQPELYSATFPNQRWRKYMMNLWAAVNHEHRLYYARYLCRAWNDARPYDEQLEEFHIYYMRNDTLPDYAPRHAQKVDLWHHFCFK